MHYQYKGIINTKALSIQRHYQCKWHYQHKGINNTRHYQYKWHHQYKDIINTKVLSLQIPLSKQSTYGVIYFVTGFDIVRTSFEIALSLFIHAIF